MKFWLILFLFSSSVFAQESRLIPLFVEASKLYLQQTDITQNHVLKKEFLLILKGLEREQISHQRLQLLVENAVGKKWPLTKLPVIDQKKAMDLPAVALHAVKFKVVEESDDMTNDDLYMYFFVTDGVIPTGKVTSIYKGLDEGDAFFFEPADRAIFPSGLAAKSPASHLLIDYGILESDGDDIKEYQALSSIIIDLALLVYQHGKAEDQMDLNHLRSEVKALSQVILGSNHDDRLATGTIVFQGDEIATLLENKTYVEFVRKHRKSSPFDDFKYEILFRLIRHDPTALVIE